MILTLRIVLVLVFAVAGFSKLADRRGSRQALQAFGVPEAATGAGAVLLPLAEVAAAGLLLFGATTAVGAWLATALLVAFAAGIARSMARGEAPDCHCFGQLHSAPAGARTLARNVVLAAMAVVVAIAHDPGPSAFGWLRDLNGTQLALVITTTVLLLLVAALARFTFELLKQNGRILQRLDQLEAGAPAQARAAAPFTLPDLDGNLASLDGLRALRRPTLLLFTDPDCGPCSALMPEIGEWQREYAAQLTIAVVSRGSADANRAKAEEHGIERVLLQQDREVALSYDAPATPSAVLVAADGTLAGEPAPGADAIRALVRRAVPNAPRIVEMPAHAAGPGGPLELRDLDGETIDLAAPAGRPRALLFWNPGCGFCERMRPDLRAWEEAAEGEIELI